MQFYIDKFISSLPSAQQAAVRSLIAKKSNAEGGMDRGAIVRELSRLAVSMENREKVYSLIDTLQLSRSGDTSIPFNDSLDVLGEDLSVMFHELDSIGSTFESLDRLTQSTEQVLQQALADLDNTLTAIESIDELPEYRFRIASHNTFNTPESIAMKPTHPLGSEVYRDPITNTEYDARNLLTIDWSVEGATLPIKKTKPRDIRNVYIVEGLSTTESDLTVSPVSSNLEATPTNGIENILKIDNKVWAKFTYLSRTGRDSPPAATAELVADLGGLVTINSLDISPAASSPFIVESISYMGADGNIYVISDTEFQINSTVTIGFALWKEQSLFKMDRHTLSFLRNYID